MKYLTRIFSIILAGQMLITPTYAYPGQSFIENIFGKKEPVKALDIKQTNSQNNNVKNNTTIGDTTIGGTTVGGSNLNSSFTAPDVITIKNFSELIKSNSETAKTALEQGNKNFQEAIDLFKATQIEQAKQNEIWKETLKALTKENTGLQIQNSGSPPIPFDVLLRNSQTTPAVYKQEESQHQLLIQTLQAINTTLNKNNNMPFPSTGGSSSRTLQTLNATGSVTAWNYTVLIGVTPLTANIVITLPTTASVTGQFINFVRVDNTTFTVSISPFTGQTLTLQSAGTELNSQNGALTVEAIDATSAQQSSNVGSAPSVAEYGEVAVAGQSFSVNASYVDFTTPINFTLPTAGTWDVTYILSAQIGAAGFFQPVIADSLNNLVPNSATQLGQPSALLTSQTMTARITTTGSASYKLRYSASVAGTLYANNLAGNGGVSKVIFRKISGFMPSSGQSVDYVDVRGTVAQTTSLASGNALFFNAPVIQGNIPVVGSTGVFTLTAGKTYRLVGRIGDFNNGGSNIMDARYQWRDITNNVLLGESGYYVAPANTSFNATTTGDAIAIITPATNITVRLEQTVYTFNPSVIGITNFSWANIIQLGTSAAITAQTRPIVMANNTSGQTLTNNSNGTVTSWTTVTDTTSNFVPATGIFTAPVAGNYQVSWGIQTNFVTTSGANSRLVGRIFKNGGQVLSGSFTAYPTTSTGGALINSGGAGIVSLAVGDTLLVNYFMSSSANTTLTTSVGENYFAVSLISSTY